MFSEKGTDSFHRGIDLPLFGNRGFIADGTDMAAIVIIVTSTGDGLADKTGAVSATVKFMFMFEVIFGTPMVLFVGSFKGESTDITAEGYMLLVAALVILAFIRDDILVACKGFSTDRTFGDDDFEAGGVVVFAFEDDIFAFNGFVAAGAFKGAAEQ